MSIVELANYFRIVWQRKWVVVLTTLIVFAVVAVISTQLDPVYRAATRLRILTTTQGEVGSLVEYNIWYADRLLNTYVQIIRSRPILDELVQTLNLDEIPEIEVEALANTEVIEIGVIHQDPVLATNAANTLSEILVEQSNSLYTGTGRSATAILGEQLAQNEMELNEARAEYEALFSSSTPSPEQIEDARRIVGLKEDVYFSLLSQYEQARAVEAIRANTVSIIEPATLPEDPFRPNTKLNLALGLMAGLVSGIGLAFLFNNLDHTLYSSAQIEKIAQLPILGEIPNFKNQRPAAFLAAIFPEAEAFRRLRTNIFSLERDLDLQTILVTSPEPTEGKSTLVAGLAFALAQTGRKVIIVDCDLRLPTQHTIYNLSNVVGLADILTGEIEFHKAIQPTRFSGVHVITSGPVLANPFDLIDTAQMRTLLRSLRQEFDMVLLDAPAFLAVTDATSLAIMADSVLLVVRRGLATQQTLQTTCEQLRQHKAKLSGVIVNRTEPPSNHRYQKYYRVGLLDEQIQNIKEQARQQKPESDADTEDKTEPAYPTQTFSKS